MMSRNDKCIALVLLLLTPASARAANVTGMVRDGESREAVAYVTVQVLGTSAEGDKLSRGIMTLEDGRYFIAGIPLGQYSVRFTRIGFAMREDTLRVTDLGATYTMDAVLGVQPVEVPEILVEGDRYEGIKDIQTGFLSMQSNDLSNLPGLVESDPIRTLQLLPGVQVASDLSTGLYVRGGGPDQTLVTLDRVTVYNPSHAFGIFSNFNADVLHEVNLYKGAYPAEQGGRLSALLDITSKTGNGEDIRGRAAVSTIAARLTLDGPVGNKGTWMLGARRTYLEPILNAVRNDDNDIPNYFFYDLNGKLSLPLAGGRLSLSGYNGKDDLSLDFDADAGVDFGWGNTLLSAAWKRRLGDKTLLDFQVSRSKYSSETALNALNTPIAFSNAIRDWTARGDITWRPNASHTVDAGLQASVYDIDYAQMFNRDTQIDFRREPKEAAVYAEDEWRPRPNTVLLLGLRTRAVNNGDRYLWEPRWSASERLGERWRAKLGGGIYHQTIQLVSTEGFSAADFYVPIDETTFPGRSWQTVAGVEFEPTPTYFMSLEGYYTDLSHLVTFKNDTAAGSAVESSEDIFYSDGDGWASGVELFVRKERGSLTGWVGYTLGWTRRQWAEINGGDTFAPKYDRRHDINVVGQVRRGKWRFGAAFVYATGQAFTPAASRYVIWDPATNTLPSDPLLLPASKNSARLLAYHRLDVSAKRDFTMFGLRADVYLQIFNFYNRRNEWFVQYDEKNNVIDATVVKMLPLIPSLGVNFRW